MSILSRLFGKKNSEDNASPTGGMEDFMQLIRVYYQAAMASNIGISNIKMLPDLAVFKRTLKVPTQNNKLGIAEKSRCKKMMADIYGLPDSFFSEIDASVKKGVKTPNDVSTYLFQFQGFSQELLMVVGNIMQWKFRLPGIFKGLLRSLCEKAISDIETKTSWKDEGMRKSVANILRYQRTLNYTDKWMTEYVYQIVRLAKKEPKPKQ